MRIRGAMVIAISTIIFIAGCNKEIQLTQDAKDWLKEYKNIGVESVDAVKANVKGVTTGDTQFRERLDKHMTGKNAVLKNLDKDQIKKFNDEYEEITDEILMRVSVLKRTQSY